MSQYKLGQRVEIADGRQGIVRFVGETEFKEGEWLGLELDNDSGKNDGSVRGERYFDCAPNHGLFIQPAPSIRILEQPPVSLAIRR
jgi:dynactin 1